MQVGRMPAQKDVAAGSLQHCQPGALPLSSVLSTAAVWEGWKEWCLSPLTCRLKNAFCLWITAGR